MTRVQYVVLVLLTSSSFCTAQVFDRYVTPLDHTLATPRAIALHSGSVYLAFDGGSVYRYDEDLKNVRQETMLDEWYIVDLVVHDSTLYACSNVGDLIGLDHTGMWEHIGQFDCEPYIDQHGVMYVAASGDLRTVNRQSGGWTMSSIGFIAALDTQIDAFAIRGDTVIYSGNRDSTLRFAAMSSSWQDSIKTYAPVERLHPIEDGSIGLEIGYEVSSTLTSDPLVDAKLSGLSYDTSFIRLENARNIRWHGKVALLGHVLFGSGHPNNGVYLLSHKDSVVRLFQFDTLIDRAYQRDYRDGQWALASISYVGLVDDSLRGRHHFAYGDTKVTPYGGYTFPATHAPYRTGSVRINGIEVPALMSSSEQGSLVRVLDAGTGKNNYLRWYHQAEDGTEVGVTSRSIIQRLPDGEWTNVLPMKDDLPWWRIVQPIRNVIAWLSLGRSLVLSTDAGRTWRQIMITGMINGIADHALSSTTLFIISYDRVFGIDINEIADTVAPPVATFQPAVFMRLMRSSDGSVNVVTGRSRTETEWNPTYFTHFHVYRWDPASGSIDSSEIELSTPITAWSLQSSERMDTLFMWSSSEARLVAITNDRVAYDTTITSLGHRAFRLYDGLRSYTDLNGTWWLINEARNYAVTLDPSRRGVVSVREEEPVRDEERLADISIAPNPASSQIRVRFAADHLPIVLYVRIRLLDLFGNTVMDTWYPSGNDANLNVADLPAGIYTVVVGNGGPVRTTKVILAH